jgi:ribose-phosphate pyrophosphokinase
MEHVTFPAGEPHYNVDPATDLTGQTVIVDLRGANSHEIVSACLAGETVRQLGAERVVLFAPYLPAARGDHAPSLSAKVYAKIINTVEFDEVICVDPHSDYMPGRILGRKVIEPETVIPADLVTPDTVIVIPDKGAVKRATRVANHFGVETVQADKIRDRLTGKLTGFSCPEIDPGRLVLVVDDICDGGGTFLGLADAMNHPWENTALWVTHGIFSQGFDSLAERFSTIACTDSFQSADDMGAADVVGVDIQVVNLNPADYL